MNSQYRLLLESIEENYNNEEFLPSSTASASLFISPSNTHQEIFLEKLINIYVLRKKEYNKINQERISHLMKEYSGSFTDLLLNMRFMSYCMENKIEVSYDKFSMLKLLTGWMDILEKIKKDEKVNLCRSVLGMIIPENKVVSKVEELIVYLNYIAVDLQQIIERPLQSKQENEDSASNIQEQPQEKSSNFPSHLNIEDLIQFLNNILPKTLYNIVIAENLLVNKPMVSMDPSEQRQHDFLFSQQSIEYFAKEKSHYQQLLKLLFLTILKHPELEQSLQRQLMLCAMRYLYIFNRNKHAESFSLFTKVYEKLSEAVRFALSDEFVLFFKIIKKIGHLKFINYLRQKYSFVEELHQKLDTGAIVGYPKDSLNAFHSFPIMESIFVNPGTMIQRFIEILEPYSLLYFYIGIKSLDINVRFYYLGGFTSATEKRQLLLNKEKCQVEFKGNIIALEKGIYMFEFDNTYSWMKGKSILYDALVLTPLDLVKGEVEKDKFLNVLFNKFEMNSCVESVNAKSLGNLNIMQSVQNNVQHENQQEKLHVNMQFDQNTQTYNLKTVGEGKIYEYETDNQNLFKNKAHEIYEALQESKGSSAFEWLVEGGVLLSGISMIEQWCSDPFGFTVSEEKKNEGEQENEKESVGIEDEAKNEEKESPQDMKKISSGEKVATLKESKEDLSTVNKIVEEASIPSTFQQESYPSLISETADSVIKTLEQPEEESNQNAESNFTQEEVPSKEEHEQKEQEEEEVPSKAEHEQEEQKEEHELEEIHVDETEEEQPEEEENEEEEQENDDEEDY